MTPYVWKDGNRSLCRVQREFRKVQVAQLAMDESGPGQEAQVCNDEWLFLHYLALFVVFLYIRVTCGKREREWQQRSTIAK